MKNNIWKISALPFTFLVIFLSLYLIWKVLDLPSETELVLISQKYFDKYGLIFIFISAIIEGLLLLGWYYPGSMVIFLGVILAGENILKATEVVSVVTVGLYIAYFINFFLGKYGWYRLLLAFGLKESLENAQSNLSKHGIKGIFLSYWHPNLAALTSTAAGILRFSLRQYLFYSAVAVIGWNIFWGALVYFLGEAALSLVGLKFIFVAIGLWIAFRFVLNKLKKQELRQEE